MASNEHRGPVCKVAVNEASVPCALPPTLRPAAGDRATANEQQVSTRLTDPRRTVGAWTSTSSTGTEGRSLPSTTRRTDAQRPTAIAGGDVGCGSLRDRRAASSRVTGVGGVTGAVVAAGLGDMHATTATTTTHASTVADSSNSLSCWPRSPRRFSPAWSRCVVTLPNGTEEGLGRRPHAPTATSSRTPTSSPTQPTVASP